MSLNDVIRDEELSTVAVVTGDDDPASTQKGVFTKLRDMDADLKTDLEAAKTAFDAHDHSGSGKGAPLGKDSGGSDIRSFSAGAVTTAKLASSAVTGAKTASGAITEAKIADETMTSAKLGDCLETTLEVPASSTATWNHGLGRNPISYAGGSVGSEAIALAGRSDSSITFGNATASPHTITIWYR